MGDTLGDFIDFADITNQINRSEMNRIYEFNLMVVGVSGVGKSTLIKSLFQGMIKPEESVESPLLNEYTESLQENGVKLRLHCIETSKYKHHNSADYVNYIDKKLNSFFEAQRKQSSCNIQDNRVHCCIYLIHPIGEMKLYQEDIDCMLALHKKVNLVPVIARADSLSPEQITRYKQRILSDLDHNKIDYFRFQHDDKEDEERYRAVKVEAERFPFAIVAADGPTIENKKTRWIRSTILGQMDISDNQKCDFDSLSKLLIRHCMLKLIDTTHMKHLANIKCC